MSSIKFYFIKCYVGDYRLSNLLFFNHFVVQYMRYAFLIFLVSVSCVLACDMIIPPMSNMAVSVCPDWILLVAAHPEMRIVFL